MRSFQVAVGLLSVAAIAAIAAIAAGPPDQLVRRGNAAFAQGDLEGAERCYAAAAEWTTDPGLVAFNRAAVLSARGEFRDAERHYARALADAAIPAERQKKALFNLGVCLLRRGGASSVYRSAINCFDGCLENAPVDPALNADARHNLEVAKILWGQARASEATPPKANDGSAEEFPLPARERDGTTPEGGDEFGDVGSDRGKPIAILDSDPSGQPTESTEGTTPGLGNLPVLPDTETPLALSPEDSRAWLKRAAARIENDRRTTNRLLAGPERTDVRDW